VLLVNDSQSNFGIGPIRLKDYIKVLILSEWSHIQSHTD
jgi:hypothetical protein